MTQTPLSVDEIIGLFTFDDGLFHFARWNRPIVPIIFGVDDTTLAYLKSSIISTVGLTGHHIGEIDQEFGANFMWFFCQSWDELLAVPDLDQLVPNLRDIVTNLNKSKAPIKRLFFYDTQGGIKLCILFLKMTGSFAQTPIQTLATGQTFSSLLVFSPQSLHKLSPIALLENNICIAKPSFAALIRAAYDPVLPVSTQAPAHAHRLAARAALLCSQMVDE